MSEQEKNSIVECKKCGRTEKVNFAYCLMKGWPTCCGYTMTLISHPSANLVDHAVRCCIGNAEVKTLER